MKCSKRNCENEGKRKRGASWYCLKHARFMQIRDSCKISGKAIPSYDDLETLFPSDMYCPACGRKMNLTKDEGAASVLTIQHDHNGGMRLMCQSCNSRHNAYPNDGYYKLPAGHKKCSICKKILPYSHFNLSAGTFAGRQLRCKECGREYANKWYHINKKPLTEKQKKSMREYYRKNRQKILTQQRLTQFK